MCVIIFHEFVHLQLNRVAQSLKKMRRRVRQIGLNLRFVSFQTNSNAGEFVIFITRKETKRMKIRFRRGKIISKLIEKAPEIILRLILRHLFDNLF